MLRYPVPRCLGHSSHTDCGLLSTCAGGEYAFPGNTDQESAVTNTFDSVVVARYLRVYPQGYVGHVSMRINLQCDDDGGRPELYCNALHFDSSAFNAGSEALTVGTQFTVDGFGQQHIQRAGSVTQWGSLPELGSAHAADIASLSDTEVLVCGQAPTQYKYTMLTDSQTCAEQGLESIPSAPACREAILSLQQPILSDVPTAVVSNVAAGCSYQATSKEMHFNLEDAANVVSSTGYRPVCRDTLANTDGYGICSVLSRSGSTLSQGASPLACASVVSHTVCCSEFPPVCVQVNSPSRSHRRPWGGSPSRSSTLPLL